MKSWWALCHQCKDRTAPQCTAARSAVLDVVTQCVWGSVRHTALHSSLPAVLRSAPCSVAGFDFYGPQLTLG
jgi:hypothetical protein